MSGPIGSPCRISYDGNGVELLPGDILRSEAGSCYLIDETRPSSRIPGRYNLRCTRMEKDAVSEGEPGVFPVFWNSRRQAPI